MVAPELRFGTSGRRRTCCDADDQRRVPVEIEHIALDPLEDRFDDDDFRLALRRRRTGSKRALLTRRLISASGTSMPTKHSGTPAARRRPTETMSRAENRAAALVCDRHDAALEGAGRRSTLSMSMSTAPAVLRPIPAGLWPSRSAVPAMRTPIRKDPS